MDLKLLRFLISIRLHLCGIAIDRRMLPQLGKSKSVRSIQF